MILRHPADVSAGEQLLLMADRGAIAEVTPDRVVISEDNSILNEALYDNLLKTDAAGNPVRIGDAMWQTKQTLYSTNDQKHHLLGDPTMRLAVPRGVVSVDTVNGQAATSLVTAGALSKVKVTGSVRKFDGSTSMSFRGQALLEVYDAKRTVPVPQWGELHVRREWQPDLSGSDFDTQWSGAGDLPNPERCVVRKRSVKNLSVCLERFDGCHRIHGELFDHGNIHGCR